jgi:hypothetical protein
MHKARSPRRLLNAQSSEPGGILWLLKWLVLLALVVLLILAVMPSDTAVADPLADTLETAAAAGQSPDGLQTSPAIT